MAMPPARVTIYRTHDDDVRQRQVIVHLDDRPRATLLFGESFTREIEPGAHKVRFDNTLVRKALTFAAASGEHVEIDVINHAGRMTLGFLSLMGVAPLFLRVERRSAVAGDQTNSATRSE
jgi:hypothetical protein